MEAAANSSSLEANEENPYDINDSNKIVCLLNRNGKLGAAYYDLHEQILYCYEEMIDPPPQFLLTQTLYREVNPKFVITFGNTTEEFIQSLIYCMNEQSETTTTTDDITALPKNLFLQSLKEFSYEICKLIVSRLQIASFDEDSNVKKELYVHSLINFDYRLSIQCLGALIKYLEKNWAFFKENKSDLQFLHMYQKSMNDHVLIDLNSFNALNIFQQRWHDSNFKRGTRSGKREALSIYKMFSVYCKSKIGQVRLRSLLLNPIKNLEELNKRLDFISFALNPLNRDFIESLQDNIKHLSDISGILFKIKNGKASMKKWQVLHKTIYHILFMNQLSEPHREFSKILQELDESVSPELGTLEKTIFGALDFTVSKKDRPVIKFGLDEALDAKMLRLQDLNKHVSAAARLIVEELPDYLNECCVMYLPEMGHLIAIKEWEANCDPQALSPLGYQYMFALKNTLHYKNAMCHELDKNLGDLNGDIIAHENRIIHRLSGFTLKYNKDIRHPLRVIALLDCLLAMATIAREYNYVRPELHEGSFHEIKDCRHPLMELLMGRIESNDFCSGDSHSRLKIITGPNGSGKSIYLKQIGLVIYLAHVGSYVPAISANIGIVDSIFSRIQTQESASVRLSSFMLDISQTTKALHNATNSSLILIDEFGKGTSIDEGIAILVGLLKHFANQRENCPHILLSTHFQQIVNHLPEDEIVEHLKMSHMEQDGCLYFLYKVVKGVSNSFAFDVALQHGMSQDLIDRAKQIFQCLKNEEPICPIKIGLPYEGLSEPQLVEYLKKVEIPALDDDDVEMNN